MTDDAKRARNAYQREWNRTHPDKVKLYHDNYWKHKADEMARETAAAAQD